ncbi:MAG: hypothetical protein J6N53_01820 [Lachnospiraceae bacterium]|nr:hypothetical protein [Lachnospiraceae bacterium]
MLCNLIYNRPEAEPNKNYIGFYRRACTRRGVDFLVLYKEDIDSGITPLPKQGFVINRTRDLSLTKALEAKGVPVFNNSTVTLLGNDKLAALHYMEEAGLPVLKTSEHIENFDRYPIIMKSRDGHGGTEVFLLQSPEDADVYQHQALRARAGLTNGPTDMPIAAKTTGISWIYQEMADTPGKDLRVYITGNRITAAMLRSSVTDFRSNFCLGGQASVYTLSPAEETIVKKTMSGLSIGHCGIDFLFHQDHLIFNELEDVVGSRMLYSYTDIDVVDDYIAYILSAL